MKSKECYCGAEVHLSSAWANTCSNCGTEYNGRGQRLAARSQWGKETGETFLPGESDPNPSWNPPY